MEPIPTPPNPFVVETGTLVIPSFQEWFFLPGDWLVYLLASRAPAVAESFGVRRGRLRRNARRFSRLDLLAHGRDLGVAAISAVRRFDRAVTGRIVYGVRELRRRVRMAMVFAQYRRKAAARRKEPTFDVSEEPGLSSDELRVLELHARLSPGFALSTSDVAHELGTAGYEIRTALERLQKLKLLQATVGGLDGETAYTLSAAGRTLLQIRHARPRVA